MNGRCEKIESFERRLDMPGPQWRPKPERNRGI
jgi:hypothetical protein